MQDALFYALMTHIRIGLTFTSLAFSNAGGGGDDVALQNAARALRIYRKVVQFRNRIHLTDRDAAEVDTALEQLRSDLQKLGQGLQDGCE